MVGAGIGLIALFYMAPLVARLGAVLPANMADPRFNAWVLAWGAQRLAHGLQGFWTPPFYYPYENTLAYSENLLGVMVFVAPVHWVFGNPTLTYNVAFFLSYVAAGLGAYLLARELTGRRDAAVVAAFAFAFGPYRWAQLNHLQVLSVGWMPLGLWALHRVFRAPSVGALALLVACLLLQALSNGYAAFQMALAVTIVAACGLVIHRVGRTIVMRMAGAAVIVGLVLAPVVRTHMRVWASQAPATTEMIQQSADLSTYLAVTSELPASRVLPGLQQNEGNLFPGFAVVALACAALTPLARRSRAKGWRYVYLGVAAVAVIVSLGPEPRAWQQPLPFPGVYGWLVATVPLFHVLRVPARFGLLVQLAVVALAAIGMASVAARLTTRQARLLVAVVVAAVLFEGYGGPLQVRAAAYDQSNDDRAVYDWLTAQPPGPLLELPLLSMGREYYGLRHQYASLKHGHRVVSGASRLRSPLEIWLAGSASPFSDPALASEAVPFLRGLGVRYVIVHADRFLDENFALRVTGILETSSFVRLAFESGNVVAYEIEESGPLPAEPLTRVPSSSFRITASHSPDRLASLVDGEPGSRWLTARPQSGDEWIALDFDEPRDVARVDLTMTARSTGDYPRSIEIVGESEQGATVLYRGAVLEQLGRGWAAWPEVPVASIVLPANRSSRLVIRQLGRANRWYWSVDELAVWNRP